MKKLMTMIITIALIMGISISSYAITEEVVDIEFLQEVKNQGEFYDIAKINGSYYVMSSVKQLRPTITFVVPDEYDGETIQIDYQAEAYRQDGSVTLLYENNKEQNAESPKMKIECPMQLDDIGQTAYIVLHFWLTFKTETTIAEPYEFSVKLTPFVEPVITAKLYYPETVVIDLQSYTVGGDITLTGGSLETINNVVVIESTRGEVASISSLSIGETVSYQENEDQSIDGNTLLPIEQTYTLEVEYENPMVSGGQRTLQLDTDATTYFTKTQTNKGLTLSINSSVEALSETKEIEVVAEITNNTEEAMVGVQLFSEIGQIATYENKIPAKESIKMPIQLVFEPGIMRDFYVLYVSSISGKAYKGVAELMIPTKINEKAPEEEVIEVVSDEVVDAVSEEDNQEIEKTTEEKEEFVSDNVVVIDEINPDDSYEGQVRDEKSKTTNIFVAIILIALGIVVLSILAIVLTNLYIKRKR